MGSPWRLGYLRIDLGARCGDSLAARGGAARWRSPVKRFAVKRFAAKRFAALTAAAAAIHSERSERLTGSRQATALQGAVRRPLHWEPAGDRAFPAPSSSATTCTTIAVMLSSPPRPFAS